MAFVLHIYCNEGFNAAFISRVSRLKYRQHIEARDVSQFLWQSLLLIIEAELDCAASTEMCSSPAACWEGSEPESSHCHHVAPACAVVWWNLSDKCSRTRSSPTNLTVIQLSSGEGRVKSPVYHRATFKDKHTLTLTRKDDSFVCVYGACHHIYNAIAVCWLNNWLRCVFNFICCTLAKSNLIYSATW